MDGAVLFRAVYSHSVWVVGSSDHLGDCYYSYSNDFYESHHFDGLPRGLVDEDFWFHALSQSSSSPDAAIYGWGGQRIVVGDGGDGGH